MGEGGATYADAGVDIAAGDAAVERLRTMVSGIGGFGGQFPLDVSRFTSPVLVSSTDGVGTKLVVARATGRYETVGVDLVAMCVDDLVCVGAEPLFMLDYLATGKVVPDTVATVVAGVHEGCRQAGCALIGGETAEHAGVMAPDEIDLAGFAVGVVEQGTQLGPDRVRVGDAVVGLASPGLRSNGYTLARHVLLDAPGSASTSRPGREPDTAWPTSCCGPRSSTPRRCWPCAPPRRRRHVCAHITGGGIVGNLPRVLPAGLGAALTGRPGTSHASSPRYSTWARWPRTKLPRLQPGDRDGAGGGAGTGRRRRGDAAGGGATVDRDRHRDRRSRRARLVTQVDPVDAVEGPPARALGQAGGLHPQVGSQEHVVHRLQADGLPPRGHAARGRRVLAVIPPEANAIGGLTMGADPVAFVTAGVAATRGRPLKAFSVRKEAKDHGAGGRIAGALDLGDRVVVTEDTVTRGTSLLEAAHAVQEAGAEVVLLVAVVDRGGTVEAMAAAEGLPFRAVLTAPDLGFAYEGG